MITPEGNQGNQSKWDDLLKDIDMTGIIGPNSLIDRVYSDVSGTQHQNTIYQVLRTRLEPYQNYFHRQAGGFGTLEELPRGVRKSLLGNNYSFELVIGDKHYPANASIKRGSNRLLMQSFELDQSKLAFDKNGNLVEATLSRQTKIADIVEEIAHYTPHDSDVHLFINNPTDMGLFTTKGGSERIYSRIEGDGILSNFVWSSQTTEDQKRAYFISSFTQAVRVISTINLM